MKKQDITAILKELDFNNESVTEVISKLTKLKKDYTPENEMETSKAINKLALCKKDSELIYSECSDEIKNPDLVHHFLKTRLNKEIGDIKGEKDLNASNEFGIYVKRCNC